MSPHPPLTPLDELPARLDAAGFAVVDARTLAEIAGVTPGAFAGWKPSWEDLPRDKYLKDGGNYRFRRHGSFVVEGDAVRHAPHRAHWQPVEYNALHGGIERWFEPLPAALVADPAWTKLLAGLARVASRMRGTQTWYVEAHPFRIDTGKGIGRPTPEGAHRDGVDLVAVILVARRDIRGGETRVFEADGPSGVRFTLDEPWSALLLDDARVVHESTPIQPADPARPGHRDTLVITLRAGGFQRPDAKS
ncbi:MAG: 2OG-Fe dioxygenase family protein [Planctomycetes bacterium]|nr:2OG-Fe dioxygenase family protein [Planctomycetota bacterium]